MNDLRDKLAALGRLGVDERTRDAGSPPEAPEAGRAPESGAAGEAPPASVDVVLEAVEQACPSGAILVRTRRFERGESWGAGALDAPRLGEVLCGYVGDGLARVRDPLRTVYVDTETTGLAGGSGTYAFLIGIGRFHGNAFVLRQLFLRGPWEERALLEVASLLLEGAEAVVTYNGKSFDVPLLRSRLAFHGLPDPLLRTPHVDLLHIARRLWRERLPACGLGDVERGALGLGRGADDVPGHLIPDLYFGFLRSGDASPLRGVMHHNELDICSLAALLGHVDDLLEGRCDPATLPLEDVVSLARTREAFGDHVEAFALFEAALGRTREVARVRDDLASDAYVRAGRLAKRLGFHEKALDFFRLGAHVITGAGGHVEARIELAKILEHRERAFGEALRWVDDALAAAARVPDRFHRMRLVADLDHRRARLARKESASQARSRASRQARSS